MHSGGHGDLVPLDQLIRDTPGAQPITSIATLNLKDFKGFAGCGCRGRSLGRLAHRGGGWRVRGVRSRRGQQPRLPGAQGRERLSRVPSARWPLWRWRAGFPAHCREPHHGRGG